MVAKGKLAKTLVIVHGAFGSPTENWFPWLREKLEEKEVHVVVPHFPTPEHQELKVWLKTLDEEIGTYPPDLLMVGHSLGSAFILRKLEQLKKPIKAAYLVSGFLGSIGQPQFDEINANFFEKPFDWKVIRKNCQRFYVYNGDNDPYVPLDMGRELARKVGVRIRIVKGGGHINAASGYREFPRLLKDISSLL